MASFHQKSFFSKICENFQFMGNLPTRKLGENSVFYVYLPNFYLKQSARLLIKNLYKKNLTGNTCKEFIIKIVKW